MSQDPITRFDISLHDKSQDITDTRLKQKDNIYNLDDTSNNDIQPDVMELGFGDRNHGRSHDLMYDLKPRNSGIYLDDNMLKSKESHYNHSSTVIK